MRAVWNLLTYAGCLVLIVSVNVAISTVATEPSIAATTPWTVQSTLPAEAGSSAISCPSATTCYVVGQNSNGLGGDIIATSDGGANWTSSTIPAGAEEINAISCPSTSTCFAVGFSGTEGLVLATTNSGSSWTTESVPSGEGALFSISCPSATTCFAAGNSGAIGTTDSGATWTAETLPSGVTFLSRISCPSVLVCFGVLNGQEVFVTTSNGGASWTNLNSLPTGPNGFQSSGLSCPSTSDCYVTGQTSISQTDVLSSTDGGSTWHTYADTAFFGGAISCPSTTTCYVVGSDSVETTANSGSSWTVVSAPTGAHYLSDISCPSTTACQAVGQGNQSGHITLAGLVGTTNSGSSWTSESPPPGEGEIGALTCPSQGVCYANSTINQFTPSDCYNGECLIGSPHLVTSLLASTDDGVSWTSVNVPGGSADVGALACISATQCLLGGAGSIVETSNSGGNWSNETIPSSSDVIMAIACPSSSDCYAVGYNGSSPIALASTNGGGTWSAQTLPSGATGELTAIACPSPTACFSGGEAALGVPDELATTTSGTSWSLQALPTSGLSMVSALACPSTTTCYLVGYSTSGTFPNQTNFPEADITTSGGATWSSLWTSSSIPTAADSAQPLTAIACSSASSCYVAGGTLMATTDDGQSWTNVGPTSVGSIDALSCSSASNCIAIGGGSGRVSNVVLVGQGPNVPTTSILVPLSGASLSGSTSLDASASNATSVKFVLFGGTYGYSGQTLCTASLTAYGWFCAWNTSSVPNVRTHLCPRPRDLPGLLRWE